MRLRFERRAQEAIKFTWGHGRYLDPWSIVHLMTGFLLGTLALWLALPEVWALCAIGFLAALYEGFEFLIGIIEDWQNSVSDIVLAVVGAGIATFFLTNASTLTQVITFSIVGLAALVLLNIGYWHYLRRRMEKK